MDIFGLLFELLFLAMGIYLYLFSIGKVTAKNEAARERGEAFRQKNGWWLKYLSLALIAIMVVNIYLHITQM